MLTNVAIVRGGNGTETLPIRLEQAVDTVLVVFEGQDRTFWRRVAPTSFELVSIWPNEEQRQLVSQHLAKQGRILVILEGECSQVPVFIEELPDNREELSLRWLSPDFAELTIKAFDWLPEPTRNMAKQAVATLQLSNRTTSYLLPMQRTTLRPSYNLDIVYLPQGGVINNAVLRELIENE
jgi:hypothetical protein